MSTFWTAHIVREHLVQAFRALPDRGVFATSKTLQPFGGPEHGAHPSTTDALSWGYRFLDSYPRARKHLFAWARCRSQRLSWSEMCRDMGWPHSSAEASRNLAAELIAEGLNREASDRQPVIGAAMSVAESS